MYSYTRNFFFFLIFPLKFRANLLWIESEYFKLNVDKRILSFKQINIFFENKTSFVMYYMIHKHYATISVKILILNKNLLKVCHFETSISKIQ